MFALSVSTSVALLLGVTASPLLSQTITSLTLARSSLFNSESKSLSTVWLSSQPRL